jgi:hypothetical protein
MKETYMTKLSEKDARWIDEQAEIFGTRSFVLSLCVRIVRACIAVGILDWRPEVLQRLLQSNSGNQGNQRNPAAQAVGERDGLRDTYGDARGPVRELRFTSLRQVRAAEAVVAREAWFITPFPTHHLTCHRSVSL